MKNDAQIQKDVMEQLKWTPSLNAAEIGVAVKDGVVTLSGMVNTYLQKKSAEDAANRVRGVRAVAEDITVGHSIGYTKTDAEIAEAVLNALKWHSALPDEKIKVKVENGVVNLEGDVEWQYQRALALTAVQSIIGVMAVNNNIRVITVATPIDVKEKIRAALQRAATVDAERISVDVIGSKAVLRGQVRSYAEKEDAEYAVWSAPGITTVENRLELISQELFAF